MLPFSDACERNKAPILDVLRAALATSASVLEVGSGTGQHAVHFALHLPHLVWQPSERAENLDSLNARIAAEGTANLRAAALLDVRQSPWPVREVDGVFTANTLHIMSWPEVQRLWQGVAQVLGSGGCCCLYGPFRYQGAYTSESNRQFDAMLQARDPASGLRDVEDLKLLAGHGALRLEQDHDLPANNRLLIFRKG
jgi:SAM-dependent methyltransferase